MVTSWSWCKTSSKHQFLFFSYGRNGKSAASLDVCLLNSCLWCTNTHILDYFQMSEEFGERECREFDAAIKQCYMDEFLCLPTTADIKSIIKFHKSQHNFDGIFGSLHCTHNYLKNYPNAWHGGFKGKENNPLIILKDICNYHTFLACFLWVWEIIEWPQYTEPISIHIQSSK